MRALTRAVAMAILFSSASLAYRISAWVPAWDSTGLASVQLNAGRLDEANPGWYTVAADGSIVKNWNAENPSLLAAMSGLDVLPTIKNYDDSIGRFNGDLVANIVNDPVRRERHAEALTQLVVTRAYNGIDIDYEALPGTARAGFSEFVAILGRKLHDAGAKLSVTVHAKKSDSDDWKGPAGHDYVQIGQHADSIKIMAYDFHWDGSEAGPISPLQWLEQVAAYAVKNVPAEKVLIGLPWYGYDWVGTRANGVTYQQATGLAATAGVPVTRDASGEATFTYGNHVVFFQDATSYARKVDHLIGKFPGIGGFAHWRSGAEDPAIWQKVDQIRGNSGGSGVSPLPPAPDPGDFSISGSSEFSVPAGRSASTNFRVTPAGGFSTTVSVAAVKLDSFAGTVSLSNGWVSPGGSTSLQVRADAHAARGNYRVRLRFSGAGKVHDQIVTISITSPRSRSARR